jgi:peptidylprolyl isomerase
MKKAFLIGLAITVFLLGACGGGHDSTTDLSARGESKPFRIPVGNIPVRGERELEFKSSGLVGPEPKAIIPDGPPPLSLALQDLIEGFGSAAGIGTTVTVQYVGVDYATGKKFSSSWDDGKPFTFKLGSGSVIEGWEQGIEGMEVGGRRELVVPPGLTYGASQQMGPIPPDSTLIFVVDLLGVEAEM